MREVPQKEPPMKGLKDLNRLELAAIVIIAIVPVTLFLIAAASFNCGAQSVDEWKVKDVATQATQEHEDEVTEPVIEHHDEARDVSCYIYKGNKDAAAAIHCVQIWRFEQLKEDLDRLKEYEP